MSTQASVPDSSQQIAIVGMAGRFPEAPDLETFWRHLAAGREPISHFSDDELAAAGVPEAVRRDPALVNVRAVMEGVDQFDAPFFGFTATEAKLTDPQHRVFLECAWEALEHAGYDPERYDGMIGVYAGADANAYNAGHLLARTHGLQSLLGNDKDYLATRVAFKLNLKGPALTIQTACSTSLVAVQVACQALIGYQCDLALAGGVGILIPQKWGFLYEPGGILSPDGHCRPFDARGQGTISGDGVGLVVLKRLDEALADGDTIHAVVLGAAINNDGAMKVGFTAPSVEGQAEVVALAQAMAAVEPETITYVEAHGTATELGDPIEAAALTDAFRAGTDKTGFCALGSLKGNVGHLNSAAGVGSLIKTVLALQHRQLPPSINYEEPNPAIDFASSPFFVNTELRPWETDGHPRRAGVSSFGVGGTNAHVILEQAPPSSPPGPARGHQLLLLSARTDSALATATAELARHLREHPELELADVAYTLQVGRRRFEHRRFAVCRDREQAIRCLEQPPPAGYREPATTSVVFLLPGQGTQYVDMARGLYEQEAAFRAEVDRCAELLVPHLVHVRARLRRDARDLRELLFPAPEEAEEAARELGRTALTQPALFTVEYALARLWMAWGVRPAAMIGHSIGEYVAACLAGVFTLEQALTVVAARGRLIGQLPAGVMLAVPLSEAAAGRFPGVSVVALNASDRTVLAGPEEAVASAERALAEEGVRGRRLDTSHAFHSEMMEPILEPFRRVFDGLTLKPPAIPWLSNLTGTWISPEEATDPDYWVDHLRRPVRFSAGVEELLSDPDRVFLEVGPGRSLGSLVGRHGSAAGDRVVASLRQPREETPDAFSLHEALGRLWSWDVDVDWGAFHEGGGRRRVPLPTYPFERQRYWLEAGRPPVVAESAGAAGKRAEVAEWLYVPSWKRALLPIPRPAAEPEHWLLLSDRSRLAEALAEQLRGGGHQVSTVVPGSGFRELGQGHHELDPAAAEDYERLLATAFTGAAPVRKIFHLWNHQPPAEPASGDAFERCQQLGCFSLLHLAHALGRVSEPSPLRIGVVTAGLFEVTGDEPLEPDRATLLGPCQVLPEELPWVECRLIDVTSPAADDGSPAERLIAELAGRDQAERVAYRGCHRWVSTLEPVGNAMPEGPSRLREEGVYLITGGLGGLGLVLAEHLARTRRARLALTSRTGLVAPEEWDAWLRSHGEQDPVSRKIRKIREIESLGAEVLVLAADVAEREQMASALERIKSRFGGLDGVFHAAGVAGSEVFRALGDTSPEHCRTHFRAKVLGLRVLAELLAPELDFCLLYSSLSTVLGGVGFGAYAAAHHFLDAFVQQRRRSGDRRWISVDWDAWQLAEAGPEGGPASSLAALAIRPGEGSAALERVLSLPELPQVIISTADPDRRRHDLRELEGSARRAAPERDGAAATHARPQLEVDYLAPRNPLEAELAEIWQEVLGYDPVGVDDNFFRLGGDSLAAIQLSTRLRDRLGIDLPVNDVFDEPTIAALAAKVERLRENAAGELEEIETRLAMVEHLSDEDVARMLAELAAEPGSNPNTGRHGGDDRQGE